LNVRPTDMANIDKLMSQYKELAERIEIEKEKVYTDLGKEIIEQLDLNNS